MYQNFSFLKHSYTSDRMIKWFKLERYILILDVPRFLLVGKNFVSGKKGKLVHYICHAFWSTIKIYMSTSTKHSHALKADHANLRNFALQAKLFHKNKWMLLWCILRNLFVQNSEKCCLSNVGVSSVQCFSHTKTLNTTLSLFFTDLK